jgi:hypothetical protein
MAEAEVPRFSADLVRWMMASAQAEVFRFWLGFPGVYT